jgi:hypothetical protein
LLTVLLVLLSSNGGQATVGVVAAPAAEQRCLGAWYVLGAAAEQQPKVAVRRTMWLAVWCCAATQESPVHSASCSSYAQAVHLVSIMGWLCGEPKVQLILLACR